MSRPQNKSETKTSQCLLPLANTPIIEYTLEFLASSGVQDVFLYTGAHADQVEDYIKYFPSSMPRVGDSLTQPLSQYLEMEASLPSFPDFQYIQGLCRLHW